MTVGVPEISLDTWGLRYVKKKDVKSGYDKLDTDESPFAGGAALGEGKDTTAERTGKQPTTTQHQQFLRDDEAATSNPRGRKDDSSGDTTTRRGATGGKFGEQTHIAPSGEGEFQLKEPASPTHGSPRGEGATDPSTRAGQALDAKGNIKHEQTRTGTSGRNMITDAPTSRGGHTIKPAKQEGSSAKPKGSVRSTQSGKDKQPAPKGGTASSGIQSTQTGADPKTPKAKPSGDVPDKVGRHITDVGTTTANPTGGGAPKIKAILDLAIIKCKLLKMKSKKKDFIEEGRPTRPAYRKDRDDDEDYHANRRKVGAEGESKKLTRCVSCGQSANKGTPMGRQGKYGEDNTGSIGIAEDPKSKPDKQSVKEPPTRTNQKYREDEEEVTSYGEGASGNQYGGKTTHGEAGDKKLTHEGRIASPKGDPEVHGGFKEQPDKRTAVKSDEIVEKAIELINEAYDEMKSSSFKKLKPVYEGDIEEAKKAKDDYCTSCGSKKEHLDSEGKHTPQLAEGEGHDEPDPDSKGHVHRRGFSKTDGTSITGTVGAANFVYSDVKEAEKQKDFGGTEHETAHNSFHDQASKKRVDSENSTAAESIAANTKKLTEAQERRAALKQ